MRSDGGVIIRKEDIGKVYMKVDGQLVEVRLIEGDRGEQELLNPDGTKTKVSMKTLGELANPALAWLEQLEVVRVKAHEVARLLRLAMVPPTAAWRFWNDVFMPTIMYRLLFATVSEAQLEKAISPAWQALKAKLRLARSSPTLLLKAVGIGDVWHQMKVERLLVLLRCLDSHRASLRETAEAMVFLEQRWESAGEPILSVGHCSPRGWSGTLVGDLRMWMKQLDLRVVGGKGLQLLRIGDAAISDMARTEEERSLLTAGAWCLEIYRISELFTTKGLLRYQLASGGWERMLSVGGTGLEGKTKEEREASAAAWVQAIRQRLCDWIADGGTMGSWRRASIRLGQLVIWREGGGMRCGRVVEVVGDRGWEDAVAVRCWARE